MFGCSSIRIAYAYDKQADFTKYNTYAFSEGVKAMGVGDINRNSIIRAVENEISAKGFTMEENPHVVLDIHVKAKQGVSAAATTSGTGYPWRYGYGGGFSTTQVNYNEYTEGTLFINMVDMSAEKIVWQGIGTKIPSESASPSKREENINYAVKSVFTKYPPQ